MSVISTHHPKRGARPFVIILHSMEAVFIFPQHCTFLSDFKMMFYVLIVHYLLGPFLGKVCLQELPPWHLFGLVLELFARCVFSFIR